MDLKEFIKETLGQITEAVKEAKEQNDNIAPNEIRLGKNGNPVIYHSKPGQSADNSYVSVIEYDLALTYEKTKNNKKGIAVMLGGIELGGKKDDETKDQVINRIKFSVPLLW